MRIANKWAVAVTVMATLSTSGLRAGDLTPPSAPASTMHTLEEIYQQQTDTQLDVIVNKLRLLDVQQRLQALDARLDAAGMKEVPKGMVLIPAGDFVMGNTFDGATANELPLHTNSISAFYMDATEVTQAKWDEVYNWALTNGYSFETAGWGKATNHPIRSVNWFDCIKWANARSETEGLTACYTLDGEVYHTNNSAVPVCDWSANGYRLPTEAEWEKAARGGAANRRFPWSDTSRISHSRANYSALGGYSYDDSDGVGYHPDYDGEGYPNTSPVGSFAPNGYGLYDMAGNLQEWCWDRYSISYYSTSPDTNPRGPSGGTHRIRRGGSWADAPTYCRVADRDLELPGDESIHLGFRLVRTAK